MAGDEEILRRVDAAAREQGARDPYARLARFYDTRPDDPRLYKLVSKLLDKGVDPNDFLDAKTGQRSGPLKRHEVGPVDPRGIRTRGDEDRDEKARAERLAGELDEPSILQRASGAVVGTVTDPRKRRQFERGLSDTITFGLAEKIARAVSPEEFGEEAAAADREAVGEGYRAAGGVAGAFTPGGTRYVATNVGRATGALAGLARGRAAGTALGAVGGAASVPLTAGGVAVGQRLAEGDVVSVPRAAWEAMKEAATNPLMMAAGTALGAAGGYASGLRGSRSQTGEDIRLVEAHGGRASLLSGAKGGAFDDPILAARRGSTAEQAEVAKAAATRIGRGLSREFERDVAAPYRRGVEELRASGADEGLMDLTNVAETARALLKSEAPTTAVRSVIRREVLKPLAKYATEDGIMLPASKANEFRQKLADLAQVGTPKIGPKNRQLREIWQAAKDVVDETPFGDVNAAYSAGKTRFEQAFRQLGAKGKLSKLPGGPGTADARERAIKQISDRLFRQGEGARLAGYEREAIEEFLATHPQYATPAALPQLLAAKDRLRLGVPEGGLLPSVRSAATRNLEPLEAGVAYPVGRALGRGAAYVGAPAVSGGAARLIEAHRASQERDRQRARTLLGGRHGR